MSTRAGTLPATAALAGVTLATAVGMGRLFEDRSYLLPFLAAAVVAHAVALLMRRRGASLVASELATAAAVSLVIVWVALPGTTWLGVPGPATLEAALHHLGQARTLFSEVVAPAPVTTGFLMAGMAGVGAVAFLADWAAFRLEALFHAVLPSLLLFVFTALLGTDENRWPMVTLYLIAVAAFLLLHHGWLGETANPWLAGRSASWLRWRLPTGAGLGLAAVLTGVVVGPQLPADDASPPWRSERDERRTTVSPLADIRGRLVEQSDREVFAVRADARSYWRLTALDTFDGQVWSSDARHRRVIGPLRPGPAGGGERVVQEFTISSLSSAWLPAAYRPERVEGVEGLGYNAALDSLVAPEGTSEGLRYRVESSVPRLTAQQLRRSPPPSAERAGLQRFVALPPVSSRVRLLASRVAATAGTSPFDRAIALQQFFRTQFTYDLGARAGHDGRALENFLFDTRRGYCEQFAGAYAVMARAVGLPTRVAVGFTPGERGPDGRYHVRALNAHAWPEVHLDGFGWVAFEPTPGRGAPNASYSGVPESQARPDNPTTATTTPPTTTAAAPTTAPAAAPEEEPQAPSSSPGQERAGPAWALLLAPVVLAAPALIPLAKWARRRRRRRAAASAAARALVAWNEASESLAQAGLPRQRGETLHEHARRVGGTGRLPPPAAGAMGELAGAAAVASYGGGPVGAEVATQAVAAAATVEAGLKAVASRPERLRRALDPRPLRPSRGVTPRA